MEIKRYYKGLGYNLRWKDRDSRLLMRHHKIIAVVRTQKEVDKEIKAFEAYLNVITLNKETPVKEPFTQAQMVLFFITTFILVGIYIIGRIF